ncbi:pyridoxine biosynthesis protein [Recurvomyces mirabilis]|nr:pyridoxine biosynthesis protein [Recurvomyces mirabilis]
MASVLNTARLSARFASRYTPRCASRRGFRILSRDEAAQNFTMPALSPTMTEGNIANWRVKEGDSFSAGDVLLEIETDKATMDVEAQDDGVMVKIMSEEGSKGVKVGYRIAVIAEAGDDAASVEIPAEDKPAEEGQLARKDRPSPQEKLAGGLDPTESSPSAAEAPPSSAPESDAEAGGAAATASAAQKETKSQSGRAQKQTYPLYPSVEHLLHTNGLTKEDANSIPASGPNGRLLKGDVLAHLGRVRKDYPSLSAARLTKLGHLDLSNIQLSKPTLPKAEAPKEAAAVPEVPQETEIAVPISLSAVIATQKKVNDTLGIFLPLSTFIARASELANEDLPLSKSRKPTANDLFNSVLGLDQVATSSRGRYTPQVMGLATPSSAVPASRAKKQDIIDMLAPKSAAKKSVGGRPGAVGISAGANVFSVVAKHGEEKRAVEYLERMKLALEKEPGRLVL